MSKDHKISFRILNIRELSYSFKDPLQHVKNINPDDTIEGKYNINYRWNLEQNLFAVVYDFVYLSELDHGSNKEEFLKLSTIVEFQVENLSSLFTVRTNQDFDIDELLETTLVGLTISTVRGILFEKTKGTIFAAFVLPVVNPNELILSRKIKELNKAN